MKKVFGFLLWISVVGLSATSLTFAYTQEQRDAYQWAYQYGITTQPSIEDANLNWNLTRQAFAKMIVNYLENTVWIQETSRNSCKFTDENKFTDELKVYAKKTCMYKIMWENWTNFSPTNIVNRAQLGTVISRILWWWEYNASGKQYYIYHLNALQLNGIMNKIDNPQAYAKRWDVMIMLKRLYEKYGSNIYINNNYTSSHSSITKNEVISLTNNDVIDYNDKIVDIMWYCTTSENTIWEIYSNEDYNDKDLNDAVDDTIEVCNNSIKKINELWDFEWDSSLKDDSMLYIANYVSYYKLFKKAIPYFSLETLSDSQQKEYENLMDKLDDLNKDIDAMSKKLWDTHEAFAKRHWYKLMGEPYENNNNDENIFSTNNNSNNITEKFDNNDATYYDTSIVYRGKDWTTYTYNTGFIDLLIKTADKKWESVLSDFLRIESNFIENWIEMANFDEEKFAEELWIDIDNLDKENMTKKEKEEIVDKFGVWAKKIVSENKDSNNKFIKDLEKVVNKVDKDDKFWLQEKYIKSKTYIEAANWFLDTYAEMITNLMKVAVTAEEWDENEEAIGQAFALIWIALAYQSSVESYQAYLNEWWINAIKLLGWELVE